MITIKYNEKCRMYVLELDSCLISIHHEQMQEILSHWGLVKYLRNIYTKNIYSLGYDYDESLLIVDDDGNEHSFTKFEFKDLVSSAISY